MRRHPTKRALRRLIWTGLLPLLAGEGAQAAEALRRPRSVYFPPTTVTLGSVDCRSKQVEQRPLVDDFRDKWYSRHLAAAGEPSLVAQSRQAGGEAGSVLRFLWLRSFHAPVVIRVEWSADGPARLIAKQLGGAGGYEPGRVAKQIDRRLSAREFGTLRRTLDGTHALRPQIRQCDSGCDGAQWVIEGRRGRDYHFAEAGSPRQGDIRTVGLAMLRLTGWRFPSDEIY